MLICRFAVWIRITGDFSQRFQEENFQNIVRRSKVMERYRAVRKLLTTVMYTLKNAEVVVSRIFALVSGIVHINILEKMQ